MNAVEVQDWQGLAAHPAAAALPMMDAEDLRALMESIRRDGFQAAHAIVLCEGQVLDGRNRLEACRRLAGEGKHFLEGGPPFVEYDGDDPQGFVFRENVARRHLTRAQKKDLIAQRLMVVPERSNNAIAKELHVSDHTVKTVREELEAALEIPRSKKSVGKDGKAYRAPKKTVSCPGSQNANVQRDTGGHTGTEQARDSEAFLQCALSDLQNLLETCSETARARVRAQAVSLAELGRWFSAGSREPAAKAPPVRTWKHAVDGSPVFGARCEEEEPEPAPMSAVAKKKKAVLGNGAAKTERVPVRVPDAKSVVGEAGEQEAAIEHLFTVLKDPLVRDPAVVEGVRRALAVGAGSHPRWGAVLYGIQKRFSHNGVERIMRKAAELP